MELKRGGLEVPSLSEREREERGDEWASDILGSGGTARKAEGGSTKDEVVVEFVSDWARITLCKGEGT